MFENRRPLSLGNVSLGLACPDRAKDLRCGLELELFHCSDDICVIPRRPDLPSIFMANMDEAAERVRSRKSCCSTARRLCEYVIVAEFQMSPSPPTRCCSGEK